MMYWIGEIPRILQLSTWVAYISNKDEGQVGMDRDRHVLAVHKGKTNQRASLQGVPGMEGGDPQAMEEGW